MTTMTEDAHWAKVRTALTDRLRTWKIPHAEAKAEGIVRDLRRSGWRVPLPDYLAQQDQFRYRRPPPRTEKMKAHIAACREAVRQAAAADE